MNEVDAKKWLENNPNHEMKERLERYVEQLYPKTASYADKNDQNQFSWGGERSSSRTLQHPFATVPMFFRRNGMTVDIVNLFQNKSIFLINNGPSFKNVDKNKLKQPGIITFGINNGAHVFRPNLWTCVDDPSRFLRSIWEDPTIMKFVPLSHFEKPIWDNKKDDFSTDLVGSFPNVIGYRRNEHFDADKWLFEDTINWGNHKDFGGGRSVMLSSIRICHLLGFKTVYLLGCDFEMSEDKKYFFEEQRSKNAINNNNNSYKKMMEYFELLRPKFDKIGFNVYNLNNESKLKAFQFKSFEEAVKQETLDVSDKTFGMYINRKKGKED
jgi:hypothetical protein